MGFTGTSFCPGVNTFLTEFAYFIVLKSILFFFKNIYLYVDFCNPNIFFPLFVNLYGSHLSVRKLLIRLNAQSSHQPLSCPRRHSLLSLKVPLITTHNLDTPTFKTLSTSAARQPTLKHKSVLQETFLIVSPGI